MLVTKSFAAAYPGLVGFIENVERSSSDYSKQLTILFGKSS